jgi:hypothetical protein
VLLEFVTQLLPVAGMLLSKILVSLLGVGVYAVLDGLSRTGRLSWRGLVWGFSARNLVSALQLALILLCIFAVDLLVAFSVYGFAGIDVALWGRAAEHPELMNGIFSLVLILPGVIPATLLMFAAPLVVLDGVRPLHATALGIRWFLSTPWAFVVTCAVSAVLLAVSLIIGFGLLLLAAIPWMSITAYIAFRDVFHGPVRASSITQLVSHADPSNENACSQRAASGPILVHL